MNRLAIDEFVVLYLLIAQRCALSKRGAWVVGLRTDFWTSLLLASIPTRLRRNRRIEFIFHLDPQTAEGTAMGSLAWFLTVCPSEKIFTFFQCTMMLVHVLHFDTHFGTPDLVQIGVPDSFSSLEVSRNAVTSDLRRRNKNKQPDGVVYFVRVVKCITLRLYFGVQPSVCFAFEMTTSKKDFFLLLSQRLSCQLCDEINKRVEMQWTLAR